jgi:signal transduction histidine kinase
MRLRPTTIRAQILTTIGAIVLGVIVVLVTLTLYFAEHQLHDLGEGDARTEVEALAARASFAAIVGADSPDVAQELMKESTGVNGIRASELVSADGVRLASREESPSLLARCGFATPHSDVGSSTTVKRVTTFWCVSAPILQRSRTDTCTAAACVVGHLHIVASTSSVDTIVRHLIEAIASAGAVMLVVALFFLWMASSKIVSPLRAIVEVMRRFADGDRAARAIESGPDEAKTISHVYNELIEAQEEQARNLEKTVAQRTLELKDATLAAQDAERYKTRFMAYMSHNMRTPLQVIRAQAIEIMNELEYGGDPAQTRVPLNAIFSECEELSLRVSQVIELTRGEAGHADFSVTTMSIESFRASLFEKSQALARQNSNDLTFNVGAGTVRTDGDKVLQIIMNLIENACKFTTHGTVDVTLDVANDEFHIEVADSGVGIPQDQIPHIWSEFRQAELGSGRRRGFGLGLAIVKQYATLLSGRYGVESVEGQGTRVWVTLPAHGASALNAPTPVGLCKNPD